MYKQLHGPISIFLYPSFSSLYFPIELNGEMLIGQDESYDYSASLRRLWMDQKWIRIVRQWNKIIKLMISVGPDARM